MKESAGPHNGNVRSQTLEQEAGQTSQLDSIGALRMSEQFVLCNIRLWWHPPQAARPCARALVRNGFVAANLSQAAYESFEQFMMVMNAAACPRPIIHAATCPTMSHDEACLLSLVSLSQQGRNGHAIMLLKRWLPPTVYRVGLTNIVNVAAALASEGLHLPIRMKITAVGQYNDGGDMVPHVLH